MKTWHPANTAKSSLDAELDALELVPAPVRRSDASHDETIRMLRSAGLTHEIPARWTRW